MTAADRLRVREARNAAVRATVLAANERLRGIMFCTGCGMDMSEWTPGCGVCNDRWWGWRRRGKVGEAVYREKAEAGKAWGMFKRELSNREQPRRGHAPTSTWAEHREALGVKNSGRLVRTPRGLI